MSTSSPRFSRLLSHIALAQVLIVAFAVLTVGSVPIFVLVFSGADDITASTAARVVRSLWPVVIVPLLGLGVCWRWRAILRYKLRGCDIHENGSQVLDQPKGSP